MKTYRHRRMLIAAGVLVMLCVSIYIFKTPLLRGMGSFLSVEASEAPTPCLVILGGNSFERGMAALPWVQDGRANQIVCTGGNIPSALLALDTVLTEAQLTQRFLIARGVDAGQITLLENNTSTFEEAEALKVWCAAQDVERITILSSHFHLKRVRKVFSDVFEATAIEVDYASASPLNYDTNFWWQSEEGLIMVNNEYMKHIYYWWKY